MLCVPPILFSRAAPYAWWSRQFVAVCQMAWSTLFMWLLEGRPEAQFHMFVSLAFLSFYRDRKVLLTATLAGIAYPVVRILALPDSFAIGASAWWRVFDHSVWIVLEAVVLMLAVRQSLKTVNNFAGLIADLQLANESASADMSVRTAELLRSREQYRLIAETTRAIPFELDLAHGRFTYVGPQGEKMLGIAEEHWKKDGFLDRLLPREREANARRDLDECVPGTFETLCSVVTGDSCAA
jgi:PAS domain-containing protein